MKTLGFRVKEAVGCLKWGLMGHISRPVEDSDAENNVNYDGAGQEVLE